MLTSTNSGRDVAVLCDELFAGRTRTPKEIERRCRRIASHRAFAFELTSEDRLEVLNLWYMALEHLERFDEALDVCTRRNDAGWSSQPDERCDVGGVLVRAHRFAEADELFEQLWNEAWDGRNRPWAVALFASLGLLVVGEHERCAAWATRGLRAALDAGDRSMGVLLAKVRGDALDALGLPADELDSAIGHDLREAPPLMSWLRTSTFGERSECGR